MTSLSDRFECDVALGLQVANLYKSYGDQIALDGVSFQVAEREILAVLGPSGCGKSTLLALIAGLEEANRGEICWNGHTLQDLPPHRRGFGLMFQDFALFPHLNVFENVAFGLKMKASASQEIKKRVGEVLMLVGLPDFEGRDVNTLSGGEAQRVALARSLAPNPRLLMLDEPLGALDRNLRERLMIELRQILRASQQTAIYVTHDQEEAFSVADRIVLMNAGKAVQTGAPHEIYRQPKTTFAARFLGLDNLIPGTIEDGRVETQIGSFPLKDTGEGQGSRRRVSVLLRPDAVQLGKGRAQELKGVIQQISFRGSTNRVFIAFDDLRLDFDFHTNLRLPALGEELIISFDPSEAVQVFIE